MTVNVINNSISKFQDECRVVNMKHEYPGYTGTVKWIVVSDLTEAQLNERYPKEMKEHSPYIYMTRLEFRPIVESHSNDRKHEMRKANSYDAYSYEDGTFEAFHPELVVHPFDGTDYEELHMAIKKIPMPHRERLIKKFFHAMNILLAATLADGMTIIEIADEEGTTKQAVSKSINKALALLKISLQNG